MKAAVPPPGLHLEGTHLEPLGLTATSVGDGIAVRVPLDNITGPFCIYGTPEQILAFAAELAAVAADHRMAAA
jgi:hypothetical protein